MVQLVTVPVWSMFNHPLGLLKQQLERATVEVSELIKVEAAA